MYLDEIYLNNRLPGYFFSGDFHALAEIVEKLPDSGTVIHIGTFLGRSAKFWIELFRSHNKKYKIICLDTYENDAEHVYDLHLTSNFAGDISTIKSFLVREKTNLEMVQYFLKDYEEIECKVYDIFLNKPEDVVTSNIVCVFDDAVHTAQGVKQCFDSWFDKIEVGGIYCGHDYNFVKDTIEDISKENKLNLVLPRKDSSMYYFIKV